MNEQVEVMHGKIMKALTQAGRNKKQIKIELDRVQEEIDKQTGSKASVWTEEYHLYLLETFKQALIQVEGQAVEREEYEWAKALMDRSGSIGKMLEKIPDPSF